MKGSKKYKLISILCIVFCVLIWVPNVVFEVASPFWIATFVIATIGIVFAALIKNYLLIIANTIMFFSFFILMGIGNIINANF
ncbi:hypothetical protein SH601_13610 [Gracilibacillus sp. S3-1-1]|uniref:Uncharacterized protein n=1 Tax=Gracilibacillus pellucidus TaxID=3095368 RepID=A0ACC6M7S9_9BACI|nr:hypothetical protein [Gracilibacillus sp. S3-1-1]MDX8047025.1 hypothetical protein [Gracilibacillus sp. S3-1-1]